MRIKKAFLILSIAAIANSANSASLIASVACSNAPKSKFQDRAKLDDILKPKGLMISKINDDHGCYKVVAVNRQFKTVVLLFNAETLQPVTSNSSGTSSDNSGEQEIDGE